MASRNWCDLPGELLQKISTSPHLPNIEDYIRFTAVCTSWKSTVTPKPADVPHHMPLLMLPHNPRSESHYSFLNISNGKVHVLNQWVLVPAEYCCGSSQGWVVILNRSTKDVYLHKPLGQGAPRVLLPSLASLRDETRLIEKAVMSCHPSLGNVDDCFVMAIMDIKKKLGYCKMGDERWIMIGEQGASYMDVTLCNNRFYVLDSSIKVYEVCNVHCLSHSPKMKQVTEEIIFPRGTHFHLVEMTGDLLLVCIHRGNLELSVFKLEFGVGKWSKMTSLDGHTLFLSGKNSFSVLASNFPWLKMNQVYFIDPWKTGIFNISDGSYERLPSAVHSKYMAHKFAWPCDPFWIAPSFW